MSVMNFRSIPIFRWAQEPWFGFHGPAYEPTLVAMFKSIPIRAWDQDTKTWWFPSTSYPQVEEHCSLFFSEEMSGNDFANFLSKTPNWKVR